MKENSMAIETTSEKSVKLTREELINECISVEELINEHISEFAQIISSVSHDFFQKKFTNNDYFSTELWTIFIICAYTTTLFRDIGAMGKFIEDKIGNKEYSKIVMENKIDIGEKMRDLTERLVLSLRTENPSGL